MSKYYSSLYRMSMTLTDPVDPAILQEALEQVSERIPTFRCRLKAGGFWWYLQRQDTIPQVLPLKKLAAFRFIDQHGFLYRVSADGNRICLDVFHALTDGSGAMSFLATLTAAYIHKRYQAQIQYNSLVLDPADRPIYREVEDSFKAVFTGRKGELEKNVDAYHIGGAVMPGQHLMDVRAVASMQQVKQACQEMDCIKVYSADGDLIKDGCGEDRTIPIVCNVVDKDGKVKSFEDNFKVCDGDERLLNEEQTSDE